ncbi:MAG: hypothetical protein VX309_03490 [Pseudomonadota bacterium]|nr:hypothetical protein [Pseudomonadota bacterium]
MLGSIAASSIMQIPLVRKGVKALGFTLGAALLAGGAYWAFDTWRDNLVEAADKAGYERAEQEFTAAIEAKNEQIEASNARLDQMGIAIGHVAAAKAQSVNLQLQPRIERVDNEVAENPMYERCAVSPGVLDDINAGRSGINREIDPGDPSLDRQGSPGPADARAGLNG